MKNVVIIGASHAAAEAVATLKKKGWQGGIVLIGDENSLPYQRPPLSKKYFNSDVSADDLLIRPAKLYADAGVELYLQRTATLIDRQNKKLELDGGEKIDYEKLIIATGTRPRNLPVAGAELPQIHYLRTLNDVDRIKSQLQAGSKLLIVGAGYIGLEVAASARKMAIEVTVLEAMDRVLARVTSPIISEFYQNMHRQEGVDIRLSTALQGFEKTERGARALLADGQSLEFDCAIIGIGVIPNTELAETAGLRCENGIVVDEYTRTEDPDIYAIGDCSNHPNFIYDRRIRLESVPNAADQARTAAASICGEEIAYNAVPWFWSDQYDVKLQTAGLLQDYDQTVIRGKPEERKFAVFYLHQGRLLAVDALNSPAEFMISKKMIPAKTSPDPELLADTNIKMKDLV